MTTNAETRKFWRRRQVIYRLFGNGQLLYIGQSQDVVTRMQQHRSVTPWFSEVDRIVIKLVRNKRDTHAIEAAAIRAEKPLYNIRYGVGWIEPRARRKSAA